VPLYSKDFALRFRWRSVEITDFMDKAPQLICFMMPQECDTIIMIPLEEKEHRGIDKKQCRVRLLHSEKRMQLAAVHSTSDRQFSDRHL
jgi:hypothetical protein